MDYTYTHARTHTHTHARAYIRTNFIDLYLYNITSSSSLCSHSVPWLGEGLSMLLPHLPVLRYPLPDGTLPIAV